MLPNIHERTERKLYDKILYEQHLHRIKTMLPTIDNSPPRKQPVSNRRLMEHIRKTRKIDFENKELLIRLAKCVQKSSIDNKLSPHIISHQKFKTKLSRTRAQLEANKITTENQMLLNRIINIPPTMKF
jgi:hypothetical protein